MSGMIRIKKLSSHNYSTWLADVRILLIERHAWDIVTGNEVEPEEGADAEEKRDYATRKAKGYSTIYFSIGEKYRPLISRTDDGKKAWEILQQHFRQHSVQRLCELMEDFLSCRPFKDESILLFSCRLKNITNQMSDLGKPVSDFLLSHQLLKYLPSEFSGRVRIMYNNWTDEEFTSDNIIKDLLIEESIIKQMLRDREACALLRSPSKLKTVTKSNRTRK